VGILDVSQTEAGNRRNDPTEENDRSAQCRCHHPKSLRIHHSVASLSSFGAMQRQESDGADLSDQK
jgi:hypothetical protein